MRSPAHGAAGPAIGDEQVILETGFEEVGALGATTPAACPATPISGCALPGRATLQIRADVHPASWSFLWKWYRGTAAKADFGTPTALNGGTSYLLCVYDDGDLIMNPAVGPDGKGR